jgi:multiple sugar transport system permease protein
MKKVIRRGLFYLTLVGFSIPILYPFWWMLTSSFKTTAEIFTFPPPLLPTTWNWSNYVEAFTLLPFALHCWNSFYIAVLVTVGTLVISSLAGYAFARIPFWGSSIIFLVLMTALMMPAEVTIIPNFTLMRYLKLTNTHVPLILIPILGANGVMATFMMRQFFLSLPHELEDAAMIDGLGRFGTYWRIVLPLAKPGLAAVAILTFLNSWNSFLEPLIYINDLHLFTIPLALNSYNDMYGTPLWAVQLAATTVSVIPVIIVYIVAQQRVVESFAFSGIK